MDNKLFFQLIIFSTVLLAFSEILNLIHTGETLDLPVTLSVAVFLWVYYFARNFIRKYKSTAISK